MRNRTRVFLLRRALRVAEDARRRPATARAARTWLGLASRLAARGGDGALAARLAGIEAGILP